jgi:hypothetical protein
MQRAVPMKVCGRVKRHRTCSAVHWSAGQGNDGACLDLGPHKRSSGDGPSRRMRRSSTTC